MRCPQSANRVSTFLPHQAPLRARYRQQAADACCVFRHTNFPGVGRLFFACVRAMSHLFDVLFAQPRPLLPWRATTEGYDGGDCCECNCDDSGELMNVCGQAGYACIDPNSACVGDDDYLEEACTDISTRGDGSCDRDNDVEGCGVFRAVFVPKLILSHLCSFLPMKRR